jgi:hypothetical protein
MLKHIFLIVLFVVLADCSFATAALTPECNVALETCKADCAQKKIYDRERGGIVTRTDFVSQCQNACLDAADWCVKQDSTTSCTTFAYHCQSECPWSIVDEMQQRIQHTDSFRRCEESCSVGAAACEPYRKSLPPRKRSKDFDQCPEAQTACYADCVLEIKDNKQDFSIIDTDYPDTCAKACAQAVQDCGVLDDAESCDTYETSCEADCPSSVTAMGQAKSDPMVKQWCRNSCAKGRAYCRQVLNLPVDRTTAPAPAAPAVKQAEPAPAQETKATTSKPSIFNIFNKPASNSSAAKPAEAKPSAQPTQHNIDHCANAEAYCKEDCRKNKIINVMNGMWPERYSNEGETDFWAQCEDACSKGKPECLQTGGFKNACQKECPRAYHDKTGNTYAQNDGQNRCQWSCAIGQEAYEGKQDRDICQMAYDSCEDDCGEMSETSGSGDSFYKTCEAACKSGETQCPNALFYTYCKTFYDTCAGNCPESSSDDDGGSLCQQACGDGAKKCQDRADVRYD